MMPGTPGTETRPVPALDNTNVELWRAIKRRDYHYDETFVFGVRSTGVYCRPSCAARTPRRDQVVFFLSSQLAEDAGFRACKRCRPNDRNFATLQRTRVEETCSFINQNLDGKLSLAELGKHANLNPFYFQRLFKRITGVTPCEYVEGERLRRAKNSMSRGESVRSAIYKAGRNSTSWLYTNPYAKLGMRPSSYKSKGRGMYIHYSIHDCQLGKLLVAGTQKGVCAVILGDSDSTLEAWLRTEFSSARISMKAASELGLWVSKILAYLEGKEVVPLDTLPLDIRATSFEYKVWKQLQAIPYGTTCSYADIARRISHPRSTRAVANACARNPVALVVPCHRVVRSDGSLGGYGFGIERKAFLIQSEQENMEKMKASKPKQAQTRSHDATTYTDLSPSPVEPATRNRAAPSSERTQ
jgi:AraC family transcriptional regulator of adaptative response/methylated-DNA-[protein]-cysteine methyltransferase